MFLSVAGGFWASKRFYTGCFQVGQPIDVTAERHHHPKVGSRLPDRMNQFAIHLRDRCEKMFVADTYLGDSVVTPLLTFKELALGGTPSLNLGWIFTSVQLRPPRLAGIAQVGANGLVQGGSPALSD